MNGRWRELTLSDVIREITVGYVGPMASEYLDSGVPFLRSQNIQPNRVDLSDIKYISEAFHAELSKSALGPGDVVVVRTGNPGTAAVIPEGNEKLNCADLVIIRPGPALDSRYLAYYFNAAAGHYVNAHLVGAVQQHFNVGAARSLRLLLPPLPEQRAIAHILGTLDDKIELNRQMNRTLEGIARAIFKSWFVDFDPVHAKAEGRDPVGMDAATAALFPDHFEDSELGPIPVGWEICPLDEIAHYQNGLAWKKYAADEGEPFLRVVKIRELRQDGFDEKSDRTVVDIKDACRVYDGDVLFSWSGSLLVDIWTGGNGALNQHLFKVTSKQFPKWFYFCWTKHHLEQFQRIAEAKATTMGHIRRRDLAAAKTVIPPDGLLELMTVVMEPFLNRMIQNRLESRTLAELRDTLLPKLISGDLVLPDAWLAEVVEKDEN